MGIVKIHSLTCLHWLKAYKWIPSGTGIFFGGKYDKNALFSASELVLLTRILIASFYIFL